MRTGEVFALTWEDIDLEKGIINIKHSVYDKPKDKDGRWYLGTTKTLSGVRKVFIGDTLKEALINYKKRQDYLKEIYGNQYKYYHLEDVINEYGKVVDKRIVINKEKEDSINLVFTKDDGAYVGTDITKYPFKVIHTELGITKCRFYDLRGTYATKLSNSGTLMNDVSELMGHSNPSITQKYYITSLEENKKIAVDNLDKITQSEVINNAIKFEVD
jgi:integrase